jgi:hypothetical protein
MHKPNCQWENYWRSLTFLDPNGPDVNLTITENGLEYDGNIHGFNPADKDETIIFNFCPLCGEHL